MTTYRIDLAYDGSGFRGMARQPGVRTVQGELEAALARVLRVPVETVCAGRTDTGVHARHQVVSFVTEAAVDPVRLRRSLDGLLGDEIAITGVVPAPDGFDARFSARWREYRYRILNSPAGDPLIRSTVWHVAAPLDPGRMDRAVSHLVGSHDFASFCRRAEGRTTVREVLAAGWTPEPPLLVFSIRATAFCHQMVRSIVGLCVDVGLGRRNGDEVPEILAAADRSAAGRVAPPQGLILWEVGY